MPVEEATQVQTGDTQNGAQPDTTSAEQAAPGVADVQTDAGDQPQAETTQPEAQTTAPEVTAPEKTYTAKELQEREAVKDREIAQHRQALAQLALERQIDDLRHQEELARARDARDVDTGTITEEEAVQRRQERYAAAKKRIDDQQAEEQRRQRVAEADKVLGRADEMGKIMAAEAFAKEYGVDAKELLADKSITSPVEMELKAAKLARKAEQAKQAKPEKYDSGQVSGAGGSSEERSLKSRYPTMFKK